jgi:hypothetical protein
MILHETESGIDPMTPRFRLIRTLDAETASEGRPSHQVRVWIDVHAGIGGTVILRADVWTAAGWTESAQILPGDPDWQVPERFATADDRRAWVDDVADSLTGRALAVLT